MKPIEKHFSHTRRHASRSSANARRLSVSILALVVCFGSFRSVAVAFIIGTTKGYGLNRTDACANAKQSAAAEGNYNLTLEAGQLRALNADKQTGGFDLTVKGCECSGDDKRGWTCSADWALHGYK